MTSLPAMTLPIADSHPLGTLAAKVHHLAHLVNAVTSLLSATLSLVSLLHQLCPHTKSSHIIETRLDQYHDAFLFSRKSLTSLVEFVAAQASQLPVDCEILLGDESGDAKIEDAVVSLRAAADACGDIGELVRALDQAQSKLDAPWKGALWNGWPSDEAWGALRMLGERLVELREEGENGVGWRRAWYQITDG